MYSKLLIWSTINTKSAIHSNGRFSWFVCLPPDWQWRQSHFHSSWYFRAFSGGRSEDCSMSLSLRKMSGISMEIYCCLPKPHLLLTCHNVASAFFRRLERVEVIPPGNGSTGLWEGRSYPAHQPKRNWARSSRPCSGKTPGTLGTLGWRGWGWFYPRWGSAQPALALARVKWQRGGFLVEQRLEKADPKAPLSAEQTGWTPSLQWQWSSFNELKVSAAEVALLANRHGRPVLPTALPKHKGHSPSDAPAWGKQCKEKGVLFKMKIN